MPASAARGEEAGDVGASVGLHHPEVGEPLGPGAVLELARVLLPPLERDVADFRMSGRVLEGEGAGAGADLQLERARSAEHPGPVGRREQGHELGAGRFGAKEWSSGHRGRRGRRDSAVYHVLQVEPHEGAALARRRTGPRGRGSRAGQLRRGAPRAPGALQGSSRARPSRGAHLRAAPGQGAPAGAGPAADHPAAHASSSCWRGRGSTSWWCSPSPLEFARTPARDFEAMLLDQARIRARGRGAGLHLWSAARRHGGHADRGGRVPRCGGRRGGAGDGGRRGGVLVDASASTSSRGGWARRGRCSGGPSTWTAWWCRATGGAGASASPPPTWTPRRAAPRLGGVRGARGADRRQVARRGGEHRRQADLRRDRGDRGGAPARLRPGTCTDRKLRVEFLERLRAEQRFASVSELTAQIQRDVEEARRGACAHLGGSLTPFFPTS